MSTKVDEMKALSSNELVDRLAEARRELFNLRFQLATGQLDNTARMSIVKKDIARVLTILRDREITDAESLASNGGNV
jgi:large subunit ribosomal protein L29